LDEIPGVAASRVDWSGRRFLLALDERASQSQVGADAARALGADARLLSGAEVREVLESYRKGEKWMRAGETLELSRFEAGVLAKRYGNEAAAEIGLAEEQTRKLVALFEGELHRAFIRAHAGRGLEDVPAEFEAAAKRILESSAEFLNAEERASLEGFLARFGSPRGR